MTTLLFDVNETLPDLAPLAFSAPDVRITALTELAAEL